MDIDEINVILFKVFSFLLNYLNFFSHLTGKKTDSWVGVDSITGEKQLVLGMDIVDRKCPKPSRNTVYFGRTLYNIILYEASTGNKWNISFSEYATSGSSSTVQDYGNESNKSLNLEKENFLYIVILFLSYC